MFGLTWICLDCGNEECFTGKMEGSANITDYCIFNNKGEWQDTTDTEYGDSDFDETEIEECAACCSSNIEEIDDEGELEEIRKGFNKPQTIKELIEK